MSEVNIAQRLRTFLLVVAACLCVGTVVELFFAEHYKEPTQFVPFVLCGLGLVVALAALLRPGRGTLRAVRIVMVLLVAGSLYGVFEHMEGNIEFEREIRPNAALSTILPKALTGASPPLAPGMLALAGTLAIAGTYAHPALARREVPSAQRREA